MTDDKIHFEPDLQGTIAGTRAKYFEWVQILGELIDNAFDADATRVEIVLNGRELTVEDDGVGCDDLGKMLTLGRHSRRVSTRLGRYGVGLKDAAWWAGGATKIETIAGGKLRVLHLDWDRMAGWFAPVPNVSDASGRMGTRVRFEAISKERRLPDGKRLEALLAELAFTYSPAIKNQKQIVFRRNKGEKVVLSRYELPLLDPGSIVDTTINVEGKSARVHVGVVRDGVENARPGISYTHAFRVITHGALGCGGLGSSRIAGWVSLGDGWTLARNKDDVTAYKDELGDAVFAVIKDVVARASGQALTLKSASLASDLTSMFRGVVGGSEENARAKREGSGDKPGGIRPTGTGKPHKQAKKTQPGTRFREVKAGHFRIDFKPCADGAAGEVDIDGRVIWLADNHVTIQQAKVSGDRRSLLIVAVTLFSAHQVYSDAPLLSMLRDGSTARKIEVVVGRLLAEMDSGESATLRVVA